MESLGKFSTKQLLPRRLWRRSAGRKRLDNREESESPYEGKQISVKGAADRQHRGEEIRTWTHRRGERGELKENIGKNFAGQTVFDHKPF